MKIHEKFKELIGYRDRKVDRKRSIKKKEIKKPPLVLSPVGKSLVEKSIGDLSNIVSMTNQMTPGGSKFDH